MIGALVLDHAPAAISPTLQLLVTRLRVNNNLMTSLGSLGCPPAFLFFVGASFLVHVLCIFHIAEIQYVCSEQTSYLF